MRTSVLCNVLVFQQKKKKKFEVDSVEQFSREDEIGPAKRMLQSQWGSSWASLVEIHGRGLRRCRRSSPPPSELRGVSSETSSAYGNVFDFHQEAGPFSQILRGLGQFLSEICKICAAGICQIRKLASERVDVIFKPQFLFHVHSCLKNRPIAE